MLRFYSRVEIKEESEIEINILGYKYKGYLVVPAIGMEVLALFPADKCPTVGNIIESEYTYLTNLCVGRSDVSIRIDRWSLTTLPIRRNFKARSHRRIVKGNNSRLNTHPLNKNKKIAFSLAHSNEIDEDIFIMGIAVNSLAKRVDNMATNTYADLSLNIKKDSKWYCVVTKIEKITN